MQQCPSGYRDRHGAFESGGLPTSGGGRGEGVFSPFVPPCVYARREVRLPVRIESAESPAEANCQLLRRFQSRLILRHRIGNTVAAPELSVARQDCRIHSGVCSVYIHTYMYGVGQYIQRRRICLEGIDTR